VNEPTTYRAAGVDIDAKYEAVESSKPAIRATFTPGVVGDIGMFGGLFDPARVGAAGELLVASTDGVGTKVKIAQRAAAGGELRWLHGIGADLVNHCVDDILVQGARPLFFLDYIAVAKMVPERVRAVIEGLAGACRENDCALIGGETAEMPGVYQDGEMDVAGTIVGAVPRERLLDGSAVHAGDRLLVLRSSGLHTNGFSLARRIVDTAGLALGSCPPELGGQSVAEALLAVHRSYLRPVRPLLERGLVRAMAHITGGGLPDNLPRVLPPGTAARVERRVPRPPIFDLLIARGRVPEEEAWRVFNMGFGMVLIVAPDQVDAAVELLAAQREEAFPAGRIVAGNGEVELV
jgi:phosphoribosylformylglycinamidine cyclo-ligase